LPPLLTPLPDSLTESLPESLTESLPESGARGLERLRSQIQYIISSA